MDGQNSSSSLSAILVLLWDGLAAGRLLQLFPLEFVIFFPLLVWSRLQSWRKKLGAFPLPALGPLRLPVGLSDVLPERRLLRGSSKAPLILGCEGFTFNFLLLSPASLV